MTSGKLDTNYQASKEQASKEERDYVKETLEKEWVTALFKKEITNLKSKIIKNFHNDNYQAFEIDKTFDTEKQSMRDIIDQEPTIKTKYEAVVKRGKAGEIKGFSEWVLLLQALAIKCIKKLANGEKIEEKLQSRNGSTFKSAEMDGILGPNTFYVLASIAKDRNISFNGVVDKPLLDAMINVCKETPVVKVDKSAAITKKLIVIPAITTDKNQQTMTTKTKAENTKIGTDEVFTIIEISDPKEKPGFWDDRRKLGETDKNTVKEIYQKIMDADKEEAKIKTIIDGLDEKVLLWLKDILTKKIYLLKEAHNDKDLEWFRTMAQMTVTRRNELITQNKQTEEATPL